MIGDFTAYYLDEQEFKTAVELNKKFDPLYIPYLVIKIVQHHNDHVFEGVICNGTTFQKEKCITKKNASTSKIYEAYNEKKQGAFTFDGITFFKIISIARKSDSEGLLFFTFKNISAPHFTERNTAFMIMPFRYDVLNQFYEENIKIYLAGCDLSINVFRSDDFTGTDVIADTILEQIKKAEFIICDITHCNKNVFFEIGFAKGINKDIVFLLEQNRPADFFDVNHIRRIEYNLERPDHFQKLLRDTLESIRNGRSQ
jgi:hypothetical protein